MILNKKTLDVINGNIVHAGNSTYFKKLCMLASSVIAVSVIHCTSAQAIIIGDDNRPVIGKCVAGVQSYADDGRFDITVQDKAVFPGSVRPLKLPLASDGDAHMYYSILKSGILVNGNPADIQNREDGLIIEGAGVIGSSFIEDKYSGDNTPNMLNGRNSQDPSYTFKAIEGFLGTIQFSYDVYSSQSDQLSSYLQDNQYTVPYDQQARGIVTIRVEDFPSNLLMSPSLTYTTPLDNTTTSAGITGTGSLFVEGPGEFVMHDRDGNHYTGGTHLKDALVSIHGGSSGFGTGTILATRSKVIANTNLTLPKIILY